MFTPFAVLAQAVRRISRDLEDLSDGLPARKRRRAARPGKPAKFATYRDPQGRFEMSYPPAWELESAQGVLVRSTKIGSFANVETVVGAGKPWLELEESVRKLGGTFEVTKRSPGPPQHVRGRIEIGPTRFAWNAWAWTSEGGTIILSTGNVIDAERGTKIERYEDKVLDAIRREFKVLSPRGDGTAPARR